MTLVEVMVATVLGGLVIAAVMALTFFSARSFAALTNYVDLDNFSRNALDTMSREIRQADRLVSGDDHNLVFQHTNPTNGTAFTVSYLYDPDTKQLVRRQQGVTEQKLLLQECDFLRFSLYQRNPIGWSYDQYPTANPDTCKLVQLSWICSRNILGKKANTESVQSAKVVIRKQ
jgi:hypothetical protein